MNNEFEIRVLNNYTALDMYSISPASSAPIAIPTDASIKFLNGGNGIRIPIASTSQEFSSQPFPTLCLNDDSDATNPWSVWSYYFTTSTSGTGASEMTEYLLHQIKFTTDDLPDSTDTSTHYDQGTAIAKFSILTSTLNESTGMELPAEFGVRGITIDLNGAQVHQLEIIVIGDLSTGIIQ